MTAEEDVCLRYFAQNKASSYTKHNENNIKGLSSRLFSLKELYWAPYVKRKGRTSNVIYDCSCIRFNIIKDSYFGYTRRNILKPSQLCAALNSISQTSNNVKSVFRNAKTFDFPELTASPIVESMNAACTVEEIEVTKNDTIGCGRSELTNSDEDDLTLDVSKFLKDTNVSLACWIFRMAGYIAYKYIFPYLFRGIVINSDEIVQIKTKAECNVPVIYILRYSSVFDSFLVSLILFLNNVRVPIVIAFKNQIPSLLSKILKQMGILFVKPYSRVPYKKFSLEEEILQGLLLVNMQKGNSLLFPILDISTGEKNEYFEDVLKVVINAIQTYNHIVDDALIAPVSVINEVNPIGKSSRGFWQNLWNIFKKKKLGLTTVTFGSPFTLSEMENPYFESELVINHALTDSVKSQIVTCTNVVSFILVYKCRGGITFEDLCDEFDITVMDLSYSKRHMAFCGKIEDVVSYALRLLDNLVIKEEINGQVIFRANTAFPFISQLSKYSKVILDNFILEAIIAYSACYIAAKRDSEDIYHNEIMEKSMKVEKTLEYEFCTVKMCQLSEDILGETLNNLVLEGVLVSPEGELLEEEQWAQRFSYNVAQENGYDDEDNDLFDDYNSEEEEEEIHVHHPVHQINNTQQPKELGQLYQMSKEDDHINRIESYRNIIKGYMDVYAVSASYLMTMVNGRVVLQEDYVNELYELLQYYVNQQLITNPEAVSKETIKNSLKMFTDQRYLRSFHYKGDMFYFMIPPKEQEKYIEQLINDIQH